MGNYPQWADGTAAACVGALIFDAAWGSADAVNELGGPGSGIIRGTAGATDLSAAARYCLSCELGGKFKTRCLSETWLSVECVYSLRLTGIADRLSWFLD